MRRACVLLWFSVCCLFLSACAAGKPPTPVTLDFSCRFAAQYDTFEATGTVQRTADKVLTITFDSPDTLSGITLLWDGEEVRMKVFGIETALPQQYLPQGALGSMLGGALDDVLDRVDSAAFAGGDLLLTGTVGEYTYTMRCDGQNGVPLSLEVPSLPLTVTFSEFFAD